jgi:hypothetical protein
MLVGAGSAGGQHVHAVIGERVIVVDQNQVTIMIPQVTPCTGEQNRAE